MEILWPHVLVDDGKPLVVFVPATDGGRIKAADGSKVQGYTGYHADERLEDVLGIAQEGPGWVNAMKR